MAGLVALLAATMFLAYANGANDNFKAVAAMFGSGASRYRTALAWAGVSTLAGSLCSVLLGSRLLAQFSGITLLPYDQSRSLQLAAPVAIGAAATVMLATLKGLPVSTTHALTGALVGYGLVVAGRAVNLQALGTSFAVPLLISPLLSMLLASGAYSIMAGSRAKSIRSPAPNELSGNDDQACCGLPAATVCSGQHHSDPARREWVSDAAHYASAGAVGFARALNDTPKIAALLSAVDATDVRLVTLAVGLAMSVGGLLSVHKVAQTMSHRITRLTYGEGLCASLSTASVVLLASRLGLPVSTTHVSCGSLFGIGVVNRTACPQMIREIVLAWLLTLPSAALCSAVATLVLRPG